MKLLKFKQRPNKVVTISNRGNTEIGSIHPRGEVFKRSIVFLSFTDLTEWTSDCLREVADFMDSQKAERRKTVRAKRPVQQPKPKIFKRSDCKDQFQCSWDCATHPGCQWFERV